MTEHTIDHWRGVAAATTPRDRLWIDGEFVDPLSERRQATVDPATGRVLAEVAAGDARDVDSAVAAARRAFADRRWAGQAPAARKEVLLRLADLIRAQRRRAGRPGQPGRGQAGHRHLDHRRPGHRRDPAVVRGDR